MTERGGASQEIGEALLAETKELFRLWHQVKAGTLSRRKFQKSVAPVEQRVKELLDEGSEYTKNVSANTDAGSGTVDVRACAWR